MILRLVYSKYQSILRMVSNQCISKKCSGRFHCATSVLLPIVFCTEDLSKKLYLSSPEELTHKFLLRQASCLTANSASQLLNQTICAVIDAAEKYKDALNNVMSLIEECQSNLGNEVLQQTVSDLIVEKRADVNTYKSQLVELESLLEYVEKVVVATSETSFLVGAEYSSVSLSEHLHSAKQEFSRIKKTLEELEHEYLKIQQFFIESSAKFEEKNNR